MRTKLANLNHCAVHFLSRDAVNLSWFDCTIQYTMYTIYTIQYTILYDIYESWHDIRYGLQY